MKDIAASVLTRLKNISKDGNINFQQMLMLFSQEELLRRISVSNYNDKLILKGGFLLFSLSQSAFRPTVDSDYLLHDFSNDLDSIKNIINEIINIENENDFISYEIKKFEEIAKQQKYSGIRANLISKIKNTRTHISLDFAVGDIIIPEVQKRELKSILSDFKSASILTYSLESIISEKLDAIITRMELTSRMKDFYDIYYIASNYDFKSRTIKEAMYQTLNYRNTAYDINTIDNILRLTSDEQLFKRWNNFCSQVIGEDLDFKIIVKLIVMFLNPPFKAMIENKNVNQIWNSQSQNWNKTNHKTPTQTQI